MSETPLDRPKAWKIVVAGDVCLDVVGVPMPPPTEASAMENWRLTGEIRTHYLPGGAMLLSQLIESAVRDLPGVTVIGPRPVAPPQLCGGASGPLTLQQFIELGPRLSRRDVVHSMLQLKEFPTRIDSKKDDRTLRVDLEAGYSGPDDGQEPTLSIEYPGAEGADVVVLDDTGNMFRSNTSRNPWPVCIGAPGGNDCLEQIVVYKLHKPLPGSGSANPLWDAVTKRRSPRTVVIVSVEDLRAAGAPISQGLSWERTALELVWQLANFAPFATLRDSPWLVVRLGLDGALLWHRAGEGKAPYKAWLVYDPVGIGWSMADGFPGHMVGLGGAFTSALTRHLCEKGQLDEKVLLDGTTAGLEAARRLWRFGFGQDPLSPTYPMGAVDSAADHDSPYAVQTVPIIPGTLTPDRAGWRLLDQLFDSAPGLRDIAVLQVATSAKLPKKKPGGPPEPLALVRERKAAALLKMVPVAEFGKLRTFDRQEIENYRALHALLKGYLMSAAPPRPLSIAVFGPPGAGKSFGVKEVAASLKSIPGAREVKTLTFNLSLYQSPEELAGAFHLVRDEALRGKVPLVFFDEFDTSLGGESLAWLRHFLSPMQDGEFLDREAPHPIGQAIFVFAGGTCATYREFADMGRIDPVGFKQRKGPDFLSRLRATLDIPSLNLLTAHYPLPDPKRPGTGPVQPAGTFNPLGPIEAIPCEAAVLLRQATILSFNLKGKAPGIVRADGSLNVHRAVLSALLFLPGFEHGNRSFEALLDMSRLAGVSHFSPSDLPPAFQTSLHANAPQLAQLVDVPFPFPPEERELIAREIHRRFLEQKGVDPAQPQTEDSLQPWDHPLLEDLRDSNRGQADHIVSRLRSVGLWFRKRPAFVDPHWSLAEGTRLLSGHIEVLARAEHDRWAAQKRRQGWISGGDAKTPRRDEPLKIHDCLFPWEDLSDPTKDLDRAPMRAIPELLAVAGYEVITS